MSENLKDIAEMVKKQHETDQVDPEMESQLEVSEEDEEVDDDAEFEIEEDEEVDDSFDDEDEEDAVIIGGDTDGVGSITDVEEKMKEEDLSEAFKITDDDLKAEMPDLDDITFASTSGKMKQTLDEYRKSLIIKSGFTVEEANEAAMNKMKKMAKEENDSFLEENPKLGVIEIDKKNMNKVSFTQEEREKMTKVKAIKLKVVEDVDLKTIKVERVDKKHKSSRLQSLDINLSHYNVPLPLMSDYCRFNGSQIIQLIQAVRYEDSTLDEIIARKASLVYNQLAGSANLKKYDDNGKIILSYQDFINKFLYHDLDMALYGILVASSMEEIESPLTCGICNEQFQWKYNLKTLLSLDHLTDDFKEKFDTILGNKSNDIFLQNLYEKNNQSIRVQSPLSNNIYEINYPTIARAINLYRMIDQKDETMLYISAFALFVSKIYVYDKKKLTFIEIEEDEYKELLDTLQAIPQEDIDMIQEFLKPYLYAPKFVLKSKCPSCGHDMTNELTIDDLVFLRARDSSTEIQS